MTGGWLNKLAMVANDRRFFGKVVAFDGEYFEIEFFQSVALRQKEKFPNASVQHTKLPSQTRVFVQTASHFWRVGRITDVLQNSDTSFTYEVRFPNSETIDIHEDKLFVRCLDRFSDPADILASGCAETQFFADRRRKALSRLRAMRSAAAGLTGLVSASIEIVPHQIAAVRRVLQDPSLRYLLADEVGLGKTIEAGAIIRQILIDDPSRTVIVLVPSVIVDQWTAELNRRFCISDFPDAVRILSYARARELVADSPPDLLVIDEAHNVIGTIDGAVPDILIRHIAEIAKSAPRLLLLSATPTLSDADRLLGLLNLLDPANYPLTDREGFRRKVEERQKIGRLLLPLRKGGTAFVIQQQAALAKQMFPDDPTVQEEADRIISALKDRGALDAAVDSLRDHIVRTYRIHQRLIRTRRIDAEQWAMRPRGPVDDSSTDLPNLSHVRLYYANGSMEISQALEGWRISAQNAPPELCHDLVPRWASLLEATSQGIPALEVFLDTRAEVRPEELPHIEELKKLSSSSNTDASRYIEAGKALKDWRAANKAQTASGLPRKIVCFASNTSDAVALSNTLLRDIGYGDVVSAVGNDAKSKAEIAASFATDCQAWVLVCDHSAEEGLNLQFAHGLLHLDLPFSPTRLEQRIGRVDRFGRRLDKISHIVVLPSDDEDSPWYAWFELLANGFRIFNRSISDVQFCVEQIEREIFEALFIEGAAGLTSKVESVKAALVDERRKLDEQHALEDLAQLNEGAKDLVAAIEDAEEDENQLAGDINPWIHQVLKLTQYPLRPNNGQYVRYFWDKETLLPQIPWRSTLKSGLDRPSTWYRRQAESFEGQDLALLRPGSVFVDALEQIARWDDRGIAYATWRVCPERPDLWRGFRLVWVVEPTITSETPVWMQDGANELRRLAAALFPETSVNQLLDEHGEPVQDLELVEVLEKPYSDEKNGSYRDINLGSRPSAFAEAIDPALFREIISRLHGTAKQLVMKNPDVEHRSKMAKDNFAREYRRRERSLSQRNKLYREIHGRDMPDLSSELEMLKLLGQAIHTPNVRLDEIGFLVVANKPPSMSV
jgi:ATP-dependent helicase HepA